MDWRRIWRALQFLLGVLLVGLAVRAIVANWHSVQAQPVDWRLTPGWIALSVVVVFAGYAVLIEAWRRVVLSLGERLSVGAATRIWFLASLGKYLPGKVWSVAGAAVLARRAGVDASVAVAGALVLQALAVASGAVAVAITARSTFQSIGPGMVPLAAAILLACCAGLALLTSQPLLDRISRVLPRSLPPLRAIRPRVLVLAFGANLVAWLAYGLALRFLARGVLPDVSLSVAQAVGVFTCSYLAGFLALFAPGGLGPRESLFILMLAGDIGIRPAAGLAVASRLLLTGTEVLPAVPLLLQRHQQPRPSADYHG
ncbi:MAG TPA: lysylphosphatidylglycerol synthase domain-containing protein [Gemmatimonadales bacterium]